MNNFAPGWMRSESSAQDGGAPERRLMNANWHAGCLLGLALGDAFGATHEGGPAERLVWRLIGRTMRGKKRWTDDTRMALDIAEWFVQTDGLDLDALAGRFASSYRWHRGYGAGAAKLLKRISRGENWRTANRSVFPDGSFGNGAAMRAPVIGMIHWQDKEALLKTARGIAGITHAHALGIDGAVLMAAATRLALKGQTGAEILKGAGALCETEVFTQRLAAATELLRADKAPDAADVAKRLGNGVAAPNSCPTALYIAARFLHLPFDRMMGFIIEVGGDVDTIGAMAGAIWGAGRGATELPAAWLERLEWRGRIQGLAEALFDRVRMAPPPP